MRLIFLLSQPRAGSTLLQLMLGAHPQIATRQEPHVALHPLLTLRGVNDHSQPYLDNFFAVLPSQTREQGIRKQLLHYYQSAAQDAPYFLDKTPRYTEIIPQLAAVFPDALYITLYRNPLAVLNSVLGMLQPRDWPAIGGDGDDHFLCAPQRLLEGERRLNEQAVRVSYEQLVAQPEETLRPICDHIGIKFDSIMIDYAKNDKSGSHLLQHDVFKRSRPTTASVERWLTDSARDPQRWRLLSDYLTRLGATTVGKMGYDYNKLEQQLEASRPRSTRPTFSLTWLLAARELRWKRLLWRLVARASG